MYDDERERMKRLFRVLDMKDTAVVTSADVHKLVVDTITGLRAENTALKELHEGAVKMYKRECAEVERRDRALKAIQDNIQSPHQFTQDQALFKFQIIDRAITRILNAPATSSQRGNATTDG